LIALGMTNASPIVAPPGGKTRVIGTNPIAFSVPDGQGGLMMHCDQSTSAVALGKITMAKTAGESIPEGWAIDAEGQPTTDPEAALQGSLVSAGGYKGWGFGLMAEILAAAMTSSTLSLHVKPLKAPEGPAHNLGQYYMLINPEVSAEFYARVNELSAAIAKDEGGRIPGQHRAYQDPVALEPALWKSVLRLASMA
jgi:(2R)-3-sulfolactate dehydrogenase (NADP+)